MKRTNVTILIICFLCIFPALFMVNVKKNQMSAECDTLQANIDSLNTLIEEQIQRQNEQKQAEKTENVNLSLLSIWIKEPKSDNFEKMAMVAESIGISRDELFKRYIDYEVLQDYMTYISENGVRTYLASVIRRRLIPPIEYDLEKSLYNPNEKLYNVKIPENLLVEKRKLEGFLTTMEDEYPLPEIK